MANLDSRSKRASSVGLLLVSVLAPPLPDATLDQGDQQHIAFSYSGVLAGGAVAATDQSVPVSWRGSSDAAVTWVGTSDSGVTWRGTSDATVTWTGRVG